MKRFHLLVCISAHGFGHFAMTAPLLNLLNQRAHIRLTVRCELPERLIRSRIKGDFDIIAESSDFGMIMNNSFDVDLDKTRIAYQMLHEELPQAVSQEKEKLLKLAPDFIIANIPYITIAAATEAKIPVIAYCSLNWAEIFQAYFQDTFSNANKIIAEMNAAYNLADCFICPEPSMAMPGLTNVRQIGPVAKLANNLRDKVNQQLDLPAQNKLVLITPGGVATPVPVNDWPKIQGIIWIAAWSYKSEREDVFSIDQIDMVFSDLLASCDAVMTKPGYGTVTETACNGIPVLYILRGDWAEEPFLVQWWHKHGTVMKISREDFFAGNVAVNLRKLWSLPSTKPISASGIQALLAIVDTYID